MPSREPVDVAGVMATLKDFQRRSVDYVFDRLYGENPTRRFLLADEVGLGKTLVARGVIARAVEHLQSQGVNRIDVVYICSNATIARQNINRLNITRKSEFELASRITELPTRVHELEANEFNFISFTPGTSFRVGHQPGQWQERLILYFLLRKTWPRITVGKPLQNVLQVGKGRQRWRNALQAFDPQSELDAGIVKAFADRLRARDRELRDRGEETYRFRLRWLMDWFASAKRKSHPQEVLRERNRFIGELRSMLAGTCIHALQPDLIILDEFQRFKHLLDPDDEAGRLARQLFHWKDARALLLSATPYKMYTLGEEAAEDNHYADFLRTLAFLFDHESRTEHVKALLETYRRATYRVAEEGPTKLRGVKDEIQQHLRSVMARTERLAVTADRSGMLREVTGHTPRLEPEHVRGYLDTQRIARCLNQRNVVEYWKSSPYLLNFMEGYQLKRVLKRRIEAGDIENLARAVASSPRAMLNWADWERYREIDPANARLKAMFDDTLDTGWWRLLWMPPSAPYYRPAGVFAEVDAEAMTKRLVFSSWQVVPRAVSAMLSYEADRRMVRSLDDNPINTPEARNKRQQLLRFTKTDGRLTGMPVLGMMYPSFALAELGDPLAAMRNLAPSSGPPTVEAVLHHVRDSVRTAMRPIFDAFDTFDAVGSVDEAWYWAAPILLDRYHAGRATESWFADIDELAACWATVEDEGGGERWRDHLAEASKAASGVWRPEGRPPDDLIDVLSRIAVGGPGVCSLRALSRTLGDPGLSRRKRARHAAGRLAWGFRSLFNIPEVMSLLRGMNVEEPYWQRVIEYGVDGCLQSVLDEYLHMLRESSGLVQRTSDEAAVELADAAAAAVGMRAATPGVDRLRLDAAACDVTLETQRCRTRFAMRFGKEDSDDGQGASRTDNVRQSFNSPFWPFVLITTSIGQEGLDFHPYCHAVVHWNLPSNPVDLEQREGRVHRYKGHAVRKNLARQHATSLATSNGYVHPWVHLFDLACDEPGRESDLVPFWVYPVEGGSTIERHVPSLPMSREATLLPALRRALAVYRMVFGQPRQDDLVDFLLDRMDTAQLETLGQELRIDLTPMPRETVPPTAP